MKLTHEALEEIQVASDGPVTVTVIGASTDDPGKWRLEVPSDVGRAFDVVAERQARRELEQDAPHGDC